ncbi:MAG: sigma-70 family RNA polymerase sigma factor [Pseudomonadota bacterium]
MNWEDLSDADLVRHFKAGDAAAFDAIVRRFQDRIYRLAAATLYDAEQAADVTQEVFIRGHKGLRAFRFRAAPFTWLYRTTRLVCLEFNRRRQTDSLDEDYADTGKPPETLVDDLAIAARVRALVAKLPERQREVVLLRIFEELSVRDTARAMGCREGTVKALLHKATVNLEASMHTQGFMGRKQ